jgi:hypothetical protein
LNLSILQEKEKIFNFNLSLFGYQFHLNKSIRLLLVEVKVDVNRLVVVYVFVNEYKTTGENDVFFILMCVLSSFTLIPVIVTQREKEREAL